MNKKILILSSSPRKNGNSDLLCDQFAKGALEAGHTVEKIRIAEKKIAYCTGCYVCQSGTCPQKDDTAEILKKMQEADVIVLATPVYFYTVCAQLKALFDRTVAIYPHLTDKHFYYIMTMADTNQEMFKGTLAALRGFLDCYEGSVESGMICALGVYQKGEVLETQAWEDAYQMGLKV
ncbi:MAG: flavodoxin family protein [Planctomycetia bacterium]|nr:flavodoxin family protein [Planctomycetia bacterium]